MGPTTPVWLRDYIRSRITPNDYGARESLEPNQNGRWVWVCADCGGPARPEPCPTHRDPDAAPPRVTNPGAGVAHEPDPARSGGARCGEDIREAAPCWYPNESCFPCWPTPEPTGALLDEEAPTDMGGGLFSDEPEES